MMIVSERAVGTDSVGRASRAVRVLVSKSAIGSVSSGSFGQAAGREPRPGAKRANPTTARPCTARRLTAPESLGYGSAQHAADQRARRRSTGAAGGPVAGPHRAG